MGTLYQPGRPDGFAFCFPDFSYSPARQTDTENRAVAGLDWQDMVVKV